MHGGGASQIRIAGGLATCGANGEQASVEVHGNLDIKAFHSLFPRGFTARVSICFVQPPRLCLPPSCLADGKARLPLVPAGEPVLAASPEAKRD